MFFCWTSTLSDYRLKADHTSTSSSQVLVVQQ